MNKNRGLLGNTLANPTAIIAPVVPSVPLGGVASSGAIVQTVTAPVTGVATPGALPTGILDGVVDTVTNVVVPVVATVTNLVNGASPAAAAPQSTVPAPSEILPTVINVVAPLAPVVVDLPNNTIVQPIAEYLQSINPPPFPNNDAVASPNLTVAPIPVNVPLPVGVPINGLLPITVPFIPLPVEIPGPALNGLVPTNVLTPILNPVAQITDPVVGPVVATATNTAQVLSPVGTAFNAALNAASPVLVPVFQTEQLLNPLGDSVNSAINTLGPVLNVTAGVVSAIDPVATSIQNGVSVAQPIIDLGAAQTTNASPVVAAATGAVGTLAPVTAAATSTLDSLNAPLTSAIGGVVAPVVSLVTGAAAPVVAVVSGVVQGVLPPVNGTVAATVASATPVLSATAQFIANNANPTILIGPQATARNTFPATPQMYVNEFYAQLQLLHNFFYMNGIKYWLTGGSLLGQYREKRFLRWGDGNALGVKAVDGPMIFEKLRAYLKTKMPFYEVWNSVHGLKLINKTMKGVATDIYFYALKDQMYVLSSDASRKQWPKDMFVAQDLYTLQMVMMGNLMLMIPQNPQSYLFSQYGSKFMNVARLNSFDHFTNAGRLLAIVDVPLIDVLLQ